MVQGIGSELMGIVTFGGWGTMRIYGSISVLGICEISNIDGGSLDHSMCSVPGMPNH
jgi:hypothetical protein